MTHDLITLPDKKDLIALDEAAADCRRAIAIQENNFTRSLTLACAMQHMRSLITPQIMQAVTALAGSPLGFLTDRDNSKEKYTPEELKDPLIEAAIRGFQPVGGEFCVISGKFYGAKAGFERLVKNFPGVTDFEDNYDYSETVGGTARVQAIASWKFNGQEDELKRMKESVNGQLFDNRIPVRINAGMGHEAVIGKAKRKFYAAIYDYLRAAKSPTPEGDVDDLFPANPQPQRRRGTLFDKEFSAPASAGVQQTSPHDAEHIAEYQQRLAAFKRKSEISAVASLVRGDARLSPHAKQEIFKLCTAAMKIPKTRQAEEKPATEESDQLAPTCQ